ncbi:fluoride efflux transporter FluC [Clavibacter zhangzhiyongii]|uniref:Fluoride-specific ion channel FluC n=1 Tax=Clavibacter zhangzhiyongii TaxID=2768071 RepID=A0A7L7Z2K7_9MICO|nr:CrcB family protein [Clavibacter zhangzhiyongii]MBM7026877.1 CrcB family protein [Clavibacter zhangzhiyongii]QOD43968.1 CrcB family protein [Clavibacter zhangzhiyongii]
MSGPLVFALICVAGGIGAALRLLVDGAVKGRVGAGYPWGTTVINVTGSFGLGLLAGAAAHAGLPHDLLLILGGGLMGGYTTFSTASLETVRLAQAGRLGAALANGLGMLVACIAAAGLGLALGAGL